MRLASVLAPHLVAARHTVEGAVYGTVSVLAVIAVAAHASESADRVLVFAAVSSGVFWAVHVYASVVADLGPAHLDLPTALREALRNEQGVIGGVAIPLAVLALGAVGVIQDDRAISWSMWSGVIVLFVTPVVWLRPHGRGWLVCLAASSVGGLLGVVLIWFKVVLH